MPQWQHQKFRKANCTGIEILTRQGERGSEMVISEMLLPLHCVINKSVNLPAQDVQERQNTESRCLLGFSPPWLLLYPWPVPCSKAHTTCFPRKWWSFPLFLRCLLHSDGDTVGDLGLGSCPLQLHCWFSGKQELSPAGLHPSGCHRLSTRRPCSAVKMPRAEVYLAKSFLLVWALCYTVKEEIWTFTVRLVSKTCD